jgi:uncharacterized membrane protein YfcA
MQGGQAVVVLLASAAVGAVGAVSGLGGGTFLVPLLTLGLGWDIRTAAGTSLLCLVATQLGVRRGLRGSALLDERAGVVLGLASLVGAAVGAELAGVVSRRFLYLLFGVVSAGAAGSVLVQPWLGSSFPSQRGEPRGSWRAGLGLLSMAGAGLVSGMLGIGGGAMNVAVMHVLLQLPLPAAAATSSFLNGVKALAGIPAYWARGDVPSLAAAPAVAGAMWGSVLGGRLLARVPARVVRVVFVPLVGWVAVQMFLRGLGG